MGAPTSADSPLRAGAASKAWGLVVAGYSTAAAALVAYLTINGASGVPAVATIGTAALAAAGLLLPATGMLQLRRSVDSTERAVRYGFAMQGFGLVGLLLAVVLIIVTASPSGYLLSAAFVVASGTSAVAGAGLLRGHYPRAIASHTRGIAYLILGTGMMFSGVGLITASNIALEYLISQVGSTVLADMGATVSACGCVLAAYSFFDLNSRGRS